MHMLAGRHDGETRPTTTGVLLADRPDLPTAPHVAGSPVVAFDDVSFSFDDNVVLRHLSFTVERGSMMILLGASGSGKSIVLKLVLGLFKPDSGRILVNGQRIDRMSETALMHVRGNMGMMFQENALFDSLTVAENVGYRLYEETTMPRPQVRRRIEEVLGIVGLDDYIDVMPSALSGGQRRRVAIARAIAAEPALVLLDDPTSGLDPITATTVDDEIVKLRDLEHVTLIVATHQMRDAFYIATHGAARTNERVAISAASGSFTAPHVRFLVLNEGRAYFEGTADELRTSTDAYLRNFLFMTLPPW